jgi:hypothetical protein
MSGKYTEGIPEGLEKHLGIYTPDERTNLTNGELRTSVRGFVPKEGWSFKIGGEETKVDPSEDVYFFFHKQDDSVEIPVAGQHKMYIPLQREQYGFSPTQRVRINPSRLELDLSRSASEVYEGILNSTEMGASELFEIVGFIVNHSMEYDFEKIIASEKELGNDTSKWNEPQRNYHPTGEEVTKGICVDAGAIVRNLLGSLGMEERFGYTCANASNSFAPHDTTVVFDKVSGEWAAINSKSPTKPYNLTPKERLVELGSPYVA